MSRPVRIEFPGANYHISNYGFEGHDIFLDEEDYLVFLNVLDMAVTRFEWKLHAYALLPDHYHLVLESPKANLSRGMRQLNGVYTQHFNRKHDAAGSVFQGRFKSVLFEKGSYLKEVSRHVVLNPLRLDMASAPDKYRWSSFRATAGLIKGPDFLDSADLLAEFGKRKKDNQRKYRRYIREGIGESSPLEQRSSQVLLGSDRFLKDMQSRLSGEKVAKRGPQRAGKRQTLQSLFRGIDRKSRGERNQLIQKAHIECGYTLMEIGNHLDLHYTTVSKVINA